jgi:molybdopterin-guanine dinucleotide biosynthesis protein MobB
MKTVVFLGYSNSGKTTSLVRVVEALAESGMKVGTLKHIHDEGFTIDTKGKDTWRHAAAGASTVVALAPQELTIIEKGDTKNLSIDHLIRIFKLRGMDYLLIEGLYRRLSRRRGVVRVLCVRSNVEAIQMLRLHPNPVCIVNRGGAKDETLRGIPVLHLPRDMPVLLQLIGASPRGRASGGKRYVHKHPALRTNSQSGEWIW